VANLALYQERLVLRDQVNCILCGNVTIIDNGEAGRVEVVPNGSNATARNCRAHGATVKHARKYDIVGVARRSCGFSNSIFSGDARTYG